MPEEAENLIYLGLNGNKLNQDLSSFSHLVSLHNLMIGNNPIFGSLKSLDSMTELCELDIENTSIDNGLEYLPEGTKYFYCTETPLLENYPELSNHTIIDEELISYDFLNYLKWKKNKEIENETQLQAKIEMFFEPIFL